MRKIMFSDKYCLTAAVLAGTKTQTRRIITGVLPEIKELRVLNDVCEYKDPYTKKWYKCNSKHQPKYKIGDEVAVAQNYTEVYSYFRQHNENVCAVMIGRFGQFHKGWTKKMFVEAMFMPHQIEITNIRVEKLQDISDNDCMAEGIIKYTNGVYTYTENGKKIFRSHLDTPRKAYAELIDKINGSGTWASNPWTFVYDFNIK